MTSVAPIPAGYHSVTPHLVVYDAVAAIDFYKRAFGATELHRMTTPEGRIMHAAIQIGDSIIMLGEECREYGNFSPTGLGGTPVVVHLYVPNSDETFERAVLAGATIKMPVQETFWGDRYGQLADPFGHAWSVATCVRHVDPADLQKAAEKAMCGAAQ